MKNSFTRITSFILALCIAAVNANITSGNVYAEDQSSSGTVLKADPSSRKLRHASESVCLMPGAEKTSVASGVITLYYDQDKVRVREVRKGSGLDSMMLDAGTSVPGKIVLGFASASPVEIKDTLADIDFEFETGYRGPLVTRWTVDELETDDSNGNSVSLDPDVLMVRQHGPGKGLSYHGEYTFTDTDGGIGLKLFLNEGIGESLVTNGVFTFTYDPDFLKYKDYAVYDKYPFLQYEVVNTEPGKVRIVCVNNAPFAIKDSMELIRLTFYPLKNGSARISYDVDELSNVVSVDDITEYTGVTYTPITTSINISIPALDAPPSPTADPTATPTVQPTSVIPVPTVDPTIEPVSTSVTAVPSLTPPTASPAAPVDAESFDVNGDGAVNMSDLLKLIKFVIDPNASKTTSADLNGDGNINSADVLELKKLLMK
ncbi:MAG: hypothetical protein J6P89_05945 [Oscillospiraceae bacterium]|nr:hypothetical protein [Oscillospiraceae bacterium]